MPQTRDRSRERIRDYRENFQSQYHYDHCDIELDSEKLQLGPLSLEVPDFADEWAIHRGISDIDDEYMFKSWGVKSNQVLVVKTAESTQLLSQDGEKSHIKFLFLK